MINGQTVGCGIITCNRPDQLLRLYRSLPLALLDGLVIVNDGQWYDQFNEIKHGTFLHNEQNLGVARTKNKAIAHLQAMGLDHIFLIEDDIYIVDPSVFERYIRASGDTGIQHFNYSQHGVMNKTAQGAPAPRVSVDFSDTLQLPLYRHCVGAFSYYSKACLAAVGLMDERYHNAFEHVDHTLEVIKAGMHPPFWFFADIPESWLLLGDEPWSLAQSTIFSQSGHQERINRAAQHFQGKHGVTPAHLPDSNEQQVLSALQGIAQRYVAQAVEPAKAKNVRALPAMALATQYCQGQGIELGAAAHNPFNLSNCLKVAPCDGQRFLFDQDLEDYQQYRIEQLRQSGEVMAVDVLGDFQSIQAGDSEFDYLISSHVIEHVPNLFSAYQESYRVLKNHGIFFCIFPKRIAAPTDATRSLTTLEQMVQAYEQGVDMRSPPEGEWRGHYQVFSLQSMLSAINHINRQGIAQWYIECIEETDSKVGNGHTVVLRKFETLTQAQWADEEALSQAIVDCVDQGKFEEALCLLKVSLSFDFFDHAKLHLVALLSHQLKDDPEAVEFMRQALILDPENELYRAEFLALAGTPYRNPVL